MKLRCALLIALACLFAAPFANASPVDPSVIINKKGGDPLFTGLFNVTLDSDGGADITFTNGLNVPITQLTIQFTDVPAPTTLSCGGNAFLACKTEIAITSLHTLTVDFIFTGGDILPGEGFTFMAAGFEGANPTATISGTPEPATIFLLLTGGAMLIGFGRKW
jgi:hypothetical protein